MTIYIYNQNNRKIFSKYNNKNNITGGIIYIEHGSCSYIHILYDALYIGGSCWRDVQRS